MTYVITAYRYGNRESHSYVVGATKDQREADIIADQEEAWRGGKYECEILIMEGTWPRQYRPLPPQDASIMADLRRGSLAAQLADAERERDEARDMVEMAYWEGWADQKSLEDFPGACWAYSNAAAALRGGDDDTV